MAREPQILTRGDWRFQFEPWSGWLRSVEWRGETVLVGIYCAVRGESWTTYRIETSNLHVGEDLIKVRSECLDAPFSWDTEIKFGEDWLSYEINGRSAHAFRTARTGLCILHPTEPRDYFVGHPDGRRERLILPNSIQPHQPFTDVQSLEWTAANGATAAVLFEGELFETEDQRNWSDASLKTYCRRLVDAVPYTLSAGECVHQAVTLRCAGGAERPNETREIVAEFPSVGIFVYSDEEVRMCRRMSAGSIATFESTALTEAIGSDVQTDFHLPPDVLQFDVPAPNAGGILWLPYHSWNAGIAGAIDRLSDVRDRGWKIGAFTPENFTEINRSRPDLAQLDAIGYGICPQVHAFDERTIFENAWAAGETFASARKFAQGKPVVPIVRFANGRDGRIDGETAFAYRLLVLASLAAAGCERFVFAEVAQTQQESPAVRELWAILKLEPLDVRIQRRGPITKIEFRGAHGRLAYRLNSSPFPIEGLAPFGVQREA